MEVTPTQNSKPLIVYNNSQINATPHMLPVTPQVKKVESQIIGINGKQKSVHQAFSGQNIVQQQFNKVQIQQIRDTRSISTNISSIQAVNPTSTKKEANELQSSTSIQLKINDESRLVRCHPSFSINQKINTLKPQQQYTQYLKQTQTQCSSLIVQKKPSSQQVRNINDHNYVSHALQPKSINCLNNVDKNNANIKIIKQFQEIKDSISTKVNNLIKGNQYCIENNQSLQQEFQVKQNYHLPQKVISTSNNKTNTKVVSDLTLKQTTSAAQNANDVQTNFKTDGSNLKKYLREKKAVDPFVITANNKNIVSLQQVSVDSNLPGSQNTQNKNEKGQSSIYGNMLKNIEFHLEEQECSKEKNTYTLGSKALKLEELYKKIQAQLNSVKVNVASIETTTKNDQDQTRPEKQQAQPLEKFPKKGYNEQKSPTKNQTNKDENKIDYSTGDNQVIFNKLKKLQNQKQSEGIGAENYCESAEQALLIDQSDTEIDLLEEIKLLVKQFPCFTELQFEEIKQIGKGKFGMVYLVKNRINNEHLVCKVIEKSFIKKLSLLRLLINEIKIGQILHDSQFVVKFLGILENDFEYKLLFEYASQGDLYALLKSQPNKRFDESTTKNYIRQIAQAVQFIHAHQVIHRDIKPENILIDQNKLKLCDFGCSAILSLYEDRKTFCGTLDYVSPEMIEGTPQTYSIDIWSIGILAYELLIGYPPFKSSSQQDTFNKILQIDMQFSESITEEAKDFISRILKPNPQERMTIKEILQHKWLQFN